MTHVQEGASSANNSETIPSSACLPAIAQPQPEIGRNPLAALSLDDWHRAGIVPQGARDVVHALLLDLTVTLRVLASVPAANSGSVHTHEDLQAVLDGAARKAQLAAELQERSGISGEREQS